MKKARTDEQLAEDASEYLTKLEMAKDLAKSIAELRENLNWKALRSDNKKFWVGDFVISIKPRKNKSFDFDTALEEMPEVEKYITRSTSDVLRVKYRSKKEIKNENS